MIIIAAVVIRSGMFTSALRTVPKTPSAVQAGAVLKQSTLDVNWSGNGRTLVLGLQTTCHFCTDSAPFFRKLYDAPSRNARIVAVFPQTVDESTQYLSKLGVRVDDVKRAILSEIGVTGTPTLMLVDSKGVVQKVWIGKLSPDREPEVLSSIAGPKTVAGGI